jgi:hypothetical protein
MSYVNSVQKVNRKVGFFSKPNVYTRYVLKSEYAIWKLCALLAVLLFFINSS